MGMFATSVTANTGGHGPVVNASLMETPRNPRAKARKVRMLKKEKNQKSQKLSARIDAQQPRGCSVVLNGPLSGLRGVADTRYNLIP